MFTKAWDPFHRRARRFAAPERVGRYARGVAWQRYISQLRSNWPIFLGLGLLPLIFAVFAEFTLRGALRWFIVGVAVISGPWLAATTALLLSGAAPQMMGLQAEEWTAQELRAMRRRGWKVISGLKPKANFDIDLIAIGPAGIFVFEVKWSGDKWPTPQSPGSYMKRHLYASINQVNWNVRDLKKLLGDSIEGLPVSAVCVLWSSDNAPETSGAIEINGVTVLRGPELRPWLRSLRSIEATTRQIETIWEELVLFDSESGSEGEDAFYRPALGRLIVRWILSVVSGFIIAVSIPIALDRLTSSWIAIYAGIIIGLVAGLVARRIRQWRYLGSGLLCGAIVSVVILLIAVLKTTA